MLLQNLFVLSFNVLKYLSIEFLSPNVMISHLRGDKFDIRKLKLAVPTFLVYEVMNAIRSSGILDDEGLALVARLLTIYQFAV
jgi:hypothetical protein